MSESKVFNLAYFGSSNATREKARVVFDSFQELTDGQVAGSPEAIVNWSGVNIASPSFLDEFISLLCPEGENNSRWDGIVFTDVEPYIQGQLHAILLRRGCQIRYAPSVQEARSGPWLRLGERMMRVG